MADSKLQTRIALKYDTYANWTLDNAATQEAKTNANLVLLKGEIGICAIGDSADAGSAQATTNPTVLFKVGDGVTPFKTLKWASALAADVYSWAKSETVELVEVEEDEGNAKVTKQYLQFKTGTSVNHTIDLSSFATDVELKAATDRIGAIEDKLGEIISPDGTVNVAGVIDEALGELDSTAEGDVTNGVANDHTIVKRVSQTDGKVTVTYGKLTKAELPELVEADIPEIHANKVIVADATTDGGGNSVAKVTLDTKLTAIDGEINSIRDSIAGGVHFTGVFAADAEFPASPNSGDIVIKGTQEYIYNGTTWEPLGDITRLGSVEEAIDSMDANLNADANKFITGIVQVDGKITQIDTARPTAENVEYSTNEAQQSITVKDKLDALSGEIDAVEDRAGKLETKVDLGENETITSKITNAITGLKHTGDKVDNTDFVASVTQTDGKVTVAYGAFPKASASTAGIVTLGDAGGAATFEEVNTLKTSTIPAITDRLDDIEGEYVRVNAGKLVMGKSGTQMIIFDCGSATDVV